MSVGTALFACCLIPLPGRADVRRRLVHRTVADTIIAGCLGGITGGGAGEAVTESGDFLTWTRSGPLPSGTTWTAVSRDSTAARRLFAELDRSGFDRENLNDPGNMTCFLARHGPGRSHEVAWPSGRRPRRLAALLAIYDQVRRPVAGGRPAAKRGSGSRR
jgi:hypothetical protein